MTDLNNFKGKSGITNLNTILRKLILALMVKIQISNIDYLYDNSIKVNYKCSFY